MKRMWFILGFFGLALTIFLWYSYALVDPNLTFVNHPLWATWRESMVQLGYYQRELSSTIYLILLVLFFCFHFFFVYTKQKIPLWILVGIVVVTTLIAYPFLSHDLFNYLFDARIFTLYGKNPYLFKPLDFPLDPWLRFMHWVHRTYPYGPTFLPISIIPVALSLGKFLPAFLLYKIMTAGWYIAGVWFLLRIKKSYAIFFASHPLVIIEGLVNGHNDLIGVSLGLGALWWAWKKHQYLISFLSGIVSTGIKYLSLPVFFLLFRSKLLWVIGGVIQLGMIGYIIVTGEIQPWYFLTLFVFVPVFPRLKTAGTVFSMGLLVSYYPYIRFGGWDILWKVQMKHSIIIVGFVISIIILITQLFYKKLKRHEI